MTTSVLEPPAIQAVHLGPTWQRTPGWAPGDDPFDEFVLPERTIGWQVLTWIGNNLLSDEVGPDDKPLPFTPTNEQKRFILWWYAVDEQGRFVYREGVLQRLKGWGKDPVASVLSAVELVGPCRFSHWAVEDDPVAGVMAGEPVGKPHPRAWIQIAAVSKDQTKNTMTLFPGIFTKACMAQHAIDIGKEVIYAYHGARRIEAVTSSPRTLEGGRPTFVIKNEALALDTPVPTPAGWTTMGELRDGDIIYGSDGRPTKVVKALPVQHGRRCFKVTFADGTSIIASDGHLWQTRVAQSAAKAKVRTTLEMVEDGRRFMVPRAGARQSPDVDLAVDPYLVGVWLGDGSTGQPNITVGDEDLADLQAQLKQRGIDTHQLARFEGKAGRIGFSNRRGFGSAMGTDVARALRSLPCYRDKHIPDRYLLAGTNQRLELLRGLMDTDGCISTGNQAIFIGRKRLASDVMALLRSLGQLATMAFVSDSRSRDGGYWRVTFTPRGIQPFGLPRKAARVKGTARDWVAIAAIEEVESVPVRCIAVDAEDHLFQAGEAGHVTHNTHHWLANNEGHEMAAVIERNATKSKDGAARSLSITNAYEPSEDSVAQREREAWEDENAGLSIDTGVMYDSLEAPPEARLRPKKDDGTEPTDDEIKAYLGAVIRAVRGDASWLNVDRTVASILDKKNPPSRSRRFWFNQVVASEDAWADPAAVDAAEDPLIRSYRKDPEADQLRIGWVATRTEEIAVFFDGGKSDDSTAMMGCRLSDGFVMTLGVWQKPPGERGKTWVAPRGDVKGRIVEVFDRFNVVAFWGDPSHATDDEDGTRFWDGILDWVHRTYSDRLQLWAIKTGDNQHSVMWDMTSPTRVALFTAAAEVFIEELENRNADDELAPMFMHDGHPATKQHLKNAHRYPNKYGVSLWKGGRESSRKIDLAVGAVGARMLRRQVLNRGLEEEKKPGEAWGSWGSYTH